MARMPMTLSYLECHFSCMRPFCPARHAVKACQRHSRISFWVSVNGLRHAAKSIAAGATCNY